MQFVEYFAAIHGAPEQKKKKNPPAGGSGCLIITFFVFDFSGGNKPFSFVRIGGA